MSANIAFLPHTSPPPRACSLAKYCLVAALLFCAAGEAQAQTTFTVTGPASVTETDADAATSAYTITRSGDALTAATTTVTWTVNHAASGGTADGDFTAVTGTVDFAAGDDTQTFTLTIVGDNLAEGDERFTLSASSTGHSAGSEYSALIRDDDTEFTVTAGDTTIVERGIGERTSHFYTVTRSGAPLTVSDPDLRWRISHGTTTDDDFAGNPHGLVTWRPAGFGEFLVSIGGDIAVEGDEEFSISLEEERIGTQGYTFGSNYAVTIVDDDNATFTVTRGPTRVTETDSDAMTDNYTITRTDRELTTTTTVTWTVNHAATLGTSDGDFAAVTGTVDFAAGDDSRTFSLRITGDNTRESDEFFTVQVSATAHDSGPAYATTRLIDDDATTFTVTGNAAVIEPDSDDDATFTIIRSGAELAAAATVTWTVNHAATAGTSDDDFAAVTGTVDFAAGDDSKTFALTVTADDLLESDESFTLSVSATGHFAGPDYPVLIRDNDTLFSIVSGPATIAETDADADTAAYLVTATGAALTAATIVTWTVSHADPDTLTFAGPTSDDDFDAVSGTLTFNAGDRLQPFTLTIIGDNLVELTEGFALSVSAAGHLAGDDYPAFITDDDILFAVTGPASVTETDADAATSDYTIFRSGQELTAATTVTWTVDHAATAGTSNADFSAITGMVDFAAGDDSKTFTLTIVGDAAMEGDEFFTVQVSNADHDAGDAQATRLIDDDTATTFTITDGPADISETDANADATYTITRGGAELTADATVTWTVSHADADDGGTSDGDFAAVTGTVDFTAGDDSLTFVLTIIGDNLAEDNENFTLGVSATGHLAGAGYPALIRNDDTQFSVFGPAAVNETDADAAATYSIFSLGVPVLAATTVTWTVSHADPDTLTFAGPTSDDDFSAVTGTVTFDAFEIAKPFSLTIIGDNTDESAESFTLSASSSEHSAGNSLPVTINDDDGAMHTIAFSSPAATIVEGASATYTVSRSGPDIADGSNIVVSWAYATGTTDPTAAADFAGDAAPAGGMLTFSGSETDKTFVIATQEDADSEPGESFTLGLTAAPAVLSSNGGVALSSDITVTIGESDRPVMLSIAAPAGDLIEGTAADFAVSFAEAITTTEAVTATWTISFPGMFTASNTDFATLSGTATIAAGTSTVGVPITAAADSLNEGAETFTVTLSDPAGGGAIAAPAAHETDAADTAAIAASDPVTVSIAADATTVNEGGNAGFTATLSNASAADITVGYFVSGTTDTPTDANGGAIVIAAGQSTGAIVLGIPFSQAIGSSADDETLTVLLRATIAVGAGGGAAMVAMAPDNRASLTVNYIDALHRIAFSSPALTITEGDSAMYTVTRDGPAITGGDIVVSWTYTAGTADDDDFSTVPAGGMLTFTGTETSKTFSIAAADDTDSEPAETFTLGLTATDTVLASNGGVVLPDDITAAIGESDRQVTISIGAPDGGLIEGTAANFLVSFAESVTTTEAVTVTWTISFPGASTASAADFATLSGTATIAAGTNSVNVPITATAENADEAAETFTVTLSDPAGGGAIAVPVLSMFSSVTANIAASDADRTISVTGPASIAEGTAGVESETYTVALTGANFGAATTVTWAVAHDTTEDADFAAAGDRSGTLMFGTSDTSMTFTLTAAHDTLNEGDESFRVGVSVSDPTTDGGTAYGATAGTTITDNADDAIAVTIAAADSSVDEGDSTTFSVTLAGGLRTADVVVPFTVGTNALVTAADFDITTPNAGSAATGGVVTFGTSGSPAATDSLNIVLAATDDDLNEAERNLLVTGAAAGATGLRTAGAISYAADRDSVNITASDALVAHLSLTAPPPASDLDEGNNATYTVTLRTGSGASDPEGTSVGAICVPFSTEVTGQQTAMPAAANDAVSGPDIALVAPHNGTCAARNTPVAPADSNGAATASVQIPARQSTANFQIMARPDAIDEGMTDETLSVTLGSPTARTGAGAVTHAATAVTVPINNINVSAAHTIAFSSPETTIAEGESATYTVSRSGPAIASGNNIVVSWTYTAGTAAAADFAGGTAPAGGMLTFSDSEMSKTFVIAVADDTDSEPAETFMLGLTAAAAVLTANGGVALPAASTTVTIAASDQQVTLSIAAPASLTEGTAADFAVNFSETVTTTEAVTVDWEISFPAVASPAIAAAAADIVAPLTGTATIAAGQSSVNVAITAAADNLNEAAETFTVTLSNAAGGGAIAAPVLHTTDFAATATIAASDPITVSIAADATSVNEGLNAEFTVTLAGASVGSAADITVAYTASGTTDTPSDANSGSIVIAAGETTGTVTLGIPPSMTLGSTSPTEMLSVALATITVGAGGGTAAAAASPNNSAMTTVNYVDTAHTLAFSSPATTIAEGESATYTVSRSGPAIASGNNIVVSWTYAAGVTDPAAAADFAGGAAPAGGMLTFSGSETSKTFVIAVAEDTDSESAETFMLGLTAAPAVLSSNGGVALPSDIAVAIGESDRPIMIGIAAPAMDASEGGMAQFTVSFAESVTTSEDLIVAYTNLVRDGMGTARNEDFAAAGLLGEATIPAGQSMATVDIPILADNLNESSETFAIRLSSVRGGGAIAAPALAASPMATATIAASDPITAAISAAATANEGESIAFAVALSGASAGSAAAITVAYTVTAGGTNSPPFTDPGAGMLVIPAGGTSGTITVRSGTSAINSGTGTLSVRIDSVTAAAGGGMVSGSGSATTTVTFRAFERFFAVAVDNATPTEGDRVTFTVTLTGTAPAGLRATVDWAISGDAADYSGAASGVLSFTALGERAIAITITDDDFIEGDAEMLTFTLSNASADTGINTASAAVTITDNDAIAVSIRGPNTISEETTAAYTVDLGGRVLTDTAVTIAATGADATHFSLSAATVTVAANERAAGFTITTTDGGGAGTENRMLVLTATANGMSGMLAVTIREDDPVAREARIEQAATTLSRATAALAVPVIARRFDPGRGLASPGVALNLGGRQVLSPPSPAAASASGGAADYAAVGIAGRDRASSAGNSTGDSSAALPAPGASATGAAASGAAPAQAPQSLAPQSLAGGGLNLNALADLAAAELEGLESVSSGGAGRPALQRLLGASGFSATSDRGGGNTLSVWGRGSYTSLDGEPAEGGTRYDYDGDSYAFHLGLDGRYGDTLAGVALGYAMGDLELRAAGAAAGERSDFESDSVTVYPYAAWQPSERLSVWALAGYGQGELEIEERTAARTRKASSDTDLWLGAAGLSWLQPAGAMEVLLRLSGTTLHGETDGGRFDNGIAYAKTETDAQQLRGEVELGRVFGFEDGGQARPYLTAGISHDFGDGSRDAATGELGTGLLLHWPRLGLETELEIQMRRASKDGRDYREYTGTGTLRYDLGGDRRGLQLALRPRFGLAQGRGLGASGAPALDGGALGGAGLAGAGHSRERGLGLHGELSYGIGDARLARGLPGLLTLYGASGLSSGAGSYGGGVRFEAARFTLDAGLRRESGGATSDSEFLLDSSIRF